MVVSREFDVIVIGSGIGGLVTATQLAAKGAKSIGTRRIYYSRRQCWIF